MGLFDQILKRTKPDYRVLMLSELNSVEQKYSMLGDYIGRMRQFVNGHSEREWNDYFSKHPTISPKAYLATAISNSAADILESGAYHVYRGVLTSQGEQLYALLMEQLDICCESGQLDSAGKEKYVRDLNRNIKSVG